MDYNFTQIADYIQRKYDKIIECMIETRDFTIDDMNSLLDKSHQELIQLIKLHMEFRQKNCYSILHTSPEE